MLRLQKERNKEISVNLRTKERLLSRTFIYALGIALGLHLLAVLIFQIHAYLNTDETTPSPTRVHADLGNLLAEGDDGIIANLDENDHLYGYLLAPLSSSPSIPQPAAAPAESQIEYMMDTSVANNPFAGIEEDWQYLFPSMPERMASQKIKVLVSGALAETALIDNGVDQAIRQLAIASGKPVSVSYAVQVEGKTGRIFWQMNKGSDERPSVLEASEQILNAMRFQQSADSFVYAGEVEIVFGKI